jgi:hypothetical protein
VGRGVLLAMTDPNLQRRLEERRQALYLAVKQQRPELYRRAVEVAHLSMVEFGGRDEVKRSASVENAIMGNCCLISRSFSGRGSEEHRQ